MPKKTGIDKITQIGDYDLFDYDREVQPILNVLLTKTVEQALLEVEEETELEEIRKYRAEYQKRQQSLHNDWEHEVKREISRIKQKNKILNNARIKREQQIKTMHKLQCLNLSKQFLKGCFLGSLQFLADHSFWRDSFTDQLHVAYKGALLSNLSSEAEKFAKSTSVLNSLVSKEFDEMSTKKQSIKKSMEDKKVQRANTRAIESTDKRTVHFTFNPLVKNKISPLSRRLQKLFDGTLEEFEAEERAAFNNYVERLADEQLEENEHNPIVFEDSPYFELDVTCLNRLSWAVADNPFFRANVEKFYPEVHVINLEGDIVATINPETKSCDDSEVTGVEYCENFRDDRLKLNDDRKIRFNLSEFKKPGYMILLTVRSNDLRGQTVNPADYNSAWFRLQNEDTFQTVDYTKVKDIEMPEGMDEDAPAENAEEDEEVDVTQRKELIYVCGRIFDDQPIVEVQRPPTRPGTTNTTRSGMQAAPADDKSAANESTSVKDVTLVHEPVWVYEKWNHLISSDQFPNIKETIANCQKESREQHKEYERKLNEAKQSLARAAEERRAAQLAALAKKKTNKKKGKKEEEPDEDREHHEEEKAAV